MRDLWMRWKMLKLPWRKTLLIGREIHPSLTSRLFCLFGNIVHPINPMQAKISKATPSGSSRTSSTQAAFVASYDLMAMFNSLISRSLLSGTSGYGRHVMTLPAYRSNKRKSGGKSS
jgi:hypothetical protein